MPVTSTTPIEGETPRAPFSSTEQKSLEQGVADVFGFTKWKDKLKRLEKDWNEITREAEKNRLKRKIEVNIETLRKMGLLKPDETLIPRRIINENINREQTTYIPYLKQSHRLAVFKCLSDPSINTENLEQEITDGLNYPGWDSQFLKCRDGAALHGWDSMEVVFDEEKPFHCANEHIGHPNLMFSRKALSLQACPFIMRKFELTPVTLEAFRDTLNFDPAQVKILLDDFNTSESKMFDNICVYKVFLKQEGIVFVGWAELGEKTTNWLKQPQPLFLGRRRQAVEMQTVNRPVPDIMTGLDVATPTLQPTLVWKDLPEKFYPIVILQYLETEEQCITQAKGRAFEDLPTQEAMTALGSLGVNGSVRASNVFGSVRKETGTGAPPKKLDISLEHGVVYSEPIEFFTTPYPDAAVFRALNYMAVTNQQESGNIAAAVVNRPDSRKTKAEIDTANQEDQQQDSLPLNNFSNFMRQILSFDWHIIQSQALQGLITLLRTMKSSPEGAMVYENDYQLIGLQYSVRAAGDVDVVKRADKLNRRFQVWPFVQGTPIQLEFIKDIIKEMLPDDARKYIEILDQAEANKDQMLVSLAQMLMSAVTDESGKLKPEFANFAPELQKVQQMIQQVMAQSQQTAQQSGIGGPQDGGNAQKIMSNNMMSQSLSNTMQGASGGAK